MQGGRGYKVGERHQRRGRGRTEPGAQPKAQVREGGGQCDPKYRRQFQVRVWAMKIQVQISVLPPTSCLPFGKFLNIQDLGFSLSGKCG